MVFPLVFARSGAQKRRLRVFRLLGLIGKGQMELRVHLGFTQTRLVPCLAFSPNKVSPREG